MEVEKEDTSNKVKKAYFDKKILTQIKGNVLIKWSVDQLFFIRGNLSSITE